MKRDYLIDKLDKYYTLLWENNMASIAEDILMDNNACESDEDPNEGFMCTMSNTDIEDAISQMEYYLNRLNPQTVQQKIDAIQSGSMDVTKDYADGFLDACKMMQDEYSLSLDIQLIGDIMLI